MPGAWHGDLFRTANGRWWLCFLGVRNCGGLGGSWHTLGRESFLAPVAWRDGWPVVEGRGSLSLFTSESARVDLELHADRVAVRRTFEDWTQEVVSAECAGPVEVEILGNP